MLYRLRLDQFSPCCVSRRRGEEAYDALKNHLNTGTVELELGGSDIISTSFLDGLVSKLLVNGETELVTFVTDDTRHIEKLKRISGLRSAILYSRASGQTQSQVPPSDIAKEEPILVIGGIMRAGKGQPPEEP